MSERRTLHFERPILASDVENLLSLSVLPIRQEIGDVVRVFNFPQKMYSKHHTTYQGKRRQIGQRDHVDLGFVLKGSRYVRCVSHLAPEFGYYGGFLLRGPVRSSHESVTFMSDAEHPRPLGDRNTPVTDIELDLVLAHVETVARNLGYLAVSS